MTAYRLNLKPGGIIPPAINIGVEMRKAAPVPAQAAEAIAEGDDEMIVFGPYIVNFDDADLVAGRSFYTPIVGDLLMDAFVFVPTAWNATAKIDIGTFVGALFGLFGVTVGARDLQTANTEDGGAGLSFYNGDPASLVTAGAWSGIGCSPMIFTADNPLKVCVSTTGRTNGSGSASTQGIAHVYIVIARATPFTP